MDTKERHIRENESVEKREERTDNADLIADSLRANGKIRKRESTKKINKLWIWFGVMILIAILLFWLWTIGMFEDISGVTNG